MSLGQHPPDVEEAAARWVVRMQDQAAAIDELLAFDNWIEAAHSHQQAYDDAMATWLEVGHLLAQPASAGRRDGRRDARRRPPWGRLSRAWMAAGALAAAAGILLVVGPLRAPAPETRVYETGKGQRLPVRLADGTRMDLNASTRISVRLGPRTRRVVLTGGEAAFDVAYDAGRPFTVVTGAGVVRVIGTEFNVRDRSGTLAVTVRRGIVQVEPAGGPRARAVRLTRGQRYEHDAGQGGDRIRETPPDDDFSWRTGRLVFRNRSLGAIVADLNAHFQRPIRIEDPGLARQTISGILVVDNEDAVLRRLTVFAPIEVVSRDGEVLLKPRGRPDH